MAHSHNILMSWNLAGKNALIVGGDYSVANRVDKLLHSKANVSIVCPQEDMALECFKSVYQHYEKGNVFYYDKEIDLDQDIDPFYDIVVICLENVKLAREVAEKSREAGISTCCSRLPELSDFHFTSEYINGPLQIGVSSSGYSPAISGRIREALQKHIPPHAVKAMENSKKLREKLRQTDPEAHTLNSKRMVNFEKLCKSLSFKQLAYIKYQEVLDIIDEDGDSAVSVSPTLVKVSSAPISLINRFSNAILGSIPNPFRSAPLTIPIIAAAKKAATVKPEAKVEGYFSYVVSSIYLTAAYPFELASSVKQTFYATANQAVEVAQQVPLVKSTLNFAQDTTSYAFQTAGTVVALPFQVASSVRQKVSSTASLAFQEVSKVPLVKSAVSRVEKNVSVANQVYGDYRKSTLKFATDISLEGQRRVVGLFEQLPVSIQDPSRRVFSYLFNY